MHVFLIVLILLLVPVVPAGAKPPTAPAKPLLIAPSSQKIIATPTPLPAASMNGITRAAAKAGVGTCLERIEQVSNFITTNTQSKFVMFLPPTEPDKQFTSASIEAQLPGMEAVYASMTAVPVNGKCDALYETIAYWEKSCTEVAKKDFAKAKQEGVVQQKIKVLSVGPTIRVFLMPTGTQGCISIKKEVVYSN